MLKMKKTLLFVLTVFLLAGLSQSVMAESGKININTASKAQLVTLNGVGDKIADRIIEYRQAQLFVIIEDLMKVKGIGQKLFDKSKNLITVKDE